MAACGYFSRTPAGFLVSDASLDGAPRVLEEPSLAAVAAARLLQFRFARGLRRAVGEDRRGRPAVDELDVDPDFFRRCRGRGDGASPIVPDQGEAAGERALVAVALQQAGGAGEAVAGFGEAGAEGMIRAQAEIGELGAVPGQTARELVELEALAEFLQIRSRLRSSLLNSWSSWLAGFFRRRAASCSSRVGVPRRAAASASLERAPVDARAQAVGQALGELVETLARLAEQRLRVGQAAGETVDRLAAFPGRLRSMPPARRAPRSALFASSSARTGTAISAAAVGVGARTSAARSISVMSVSWPTAEISGIVQSATARTTISSLNAQRSSSEPPPRATISTSGRGDGAVRRQAR